MKKFLLFAIILIIPCSVCQGTPLTDKNNSVGLDLPTIGWLHPTNNETKTDQKISNSGVNFGIGVSYKRYFDYIQTDQFNNYWSGGTVLFVIPYLGLGTDYIWENGFYLGCGLFWIVPEVHGGFMF